jgi:xylulokinase
MAHLVAGVDSSTQSCKVLVCDSDTGLVVREGTASHPAGTEVSPAAWWTALAEAIGQAGGLGDVEALSVGGQQHGMVALDSSGAVIRDALLWNDTRSAEAAQDLIVELGAGDAQAGRLAWARAVGSVPVASFTVTKLRWLADHEPENAARIAAICLPHDWLTWRLSGAATLDALVTDRSDASGTGYFDSVSNAYRRDLLSLALRRDATAIVLPGVLGPADPGPRATELGAQAILGPGCGDNAGAALGLGLSAGSTSLSLGTSGVVASVSDTPTADPSGLVTGFADASGGFLPLACTLNGSRVLDAAARLLGVDYAELDDLALSSDPGAGGLVQVPYLEGERTPNLPRATGLMTGLTLTSMTRGNLARAAMEGLLCLMSECLDAIRAQGVTVDRVTLIGGGAQSAAIRVLAPGILGVTVDVPPAGQYVARGAARQAAWVLSGAQTPPAWPIEGQQTFTAPDQPGLRRSYRRAARVAAVLADPEPVSSRRA